MIDVWTEKYRPDSLEDVVGHDDIQDRLKAFVEEESVPHLLFAGPAGTGKCLEGSTPVIKSNGRIKPIRDIVENKTDSKGYSEVRNLSVIGVDDSGNMREAKVKSVFKEEADQTLELSTNEGFKQKVTPEHPMLTLKNGLPAWREADNLELGDMIAVPEKLDVKDENKGFIDELDGKRFKVKLRDDYDVPVSEKFIGDKKKLLAAVENGADTYEGLEKKLSIKPNNIRSYISQLRKEEVIENDEIEIAGSNEGNLVSLEYCRENGVSEKCIEKLVYVNRFGNFSAEIDPVTEVTPDLLEFLGFILAEGTFGSSRIKFYNKDEVLLDRFEELSRDLFGVEPVRKEEKGVPVQVFRKAGTTVKLLEQIFDLPLESKRKSHNISLNHYTTSASEEAIKRFLRSYADSEAYVSNQGVEITTASEEIASQMTYLLKRLGIHSRIKDEQKSASNGAGEIREYHTVLVSGSRNLNKFREEVDFLVDQKREELARLCERKEVPNQDVVENNPENYREVLEKLGIEKKSVFSEQKQWIIESQTDSIGRRTHKEQMEKLVERSREKIGSLLRQKEELESFQEHMKVFSEFEKNYSEIKKVLRPLEIRKQVEDETGVRYDRLLEYSKGKRVPDSGRISSIAQVESVDASNEVVEALENLNKFQTVVKEAIEESRLSYSRIGRKMGCSSSTIQNVIKGTLEPSTVPNLAEVHNIVLNDLENVLSDESVLDKLQRLEFMANSEIRWVKLESIEEKEGETVYDLTVPETQNFVAGRVPTIVHNTTSAIALAKDLYGDEWKQNFMETNASDDRGINVVREKIKDFARTKPVNADFKIIFLDEADALTADAQQALRRTMEQFSSNARFILSCNYSSKIIDPIQSRCAVFRFNRLEDDKVKEYIKRIANEEDFKITGSAVDAVLRVSEGDLRRVTNILQTTALHTDKIEEEDVYTAAGSLRPEEIGEILEEALEGDFMDARDELSELMIDRGLDGQDVISSIHRELFELDIEDRQKLEMIEGLAEFEFRIAEGGTDDIQIEALLAKVANLKE